MRLNIRIYIISLPQHRILIRLFFPPAEVHFCCTDDGRFGNRGQGQICKKSPDHQTLFRSADDAGAETAGETYSGVSIHY